MGRWGGGEFYLFPGNGRWGYANCDNRRTFEGRFNLTLTEACLTSGGKECDGEIKVVPNVVETTAQRG
jgi:hypothetical protein